MFSDADLQLILSKRKDKSVISLSETDTIAPGQFVSD